MCLRNERLIFIISLSAFTIYCAYLNTTFFYGATPKENNYRLMLNPTLISSFVAIALKFLIYVYKFLYIYVCVCARVKVVDLCKVIVKSVFYSFFAYNILKMVYL